MNKRGNGCFGCFGSAILFLMILAIIGAFTGDDDKSSETTTVKVSETEEISVTQQEPSEVTTEKVTNEDPLKSGREKLKTKKYKYITNADLIKYAPNMKGVKVYTVVNVGEIKDEEIKANLTDDFMYSSFNVGDRFDSYKKLLKEEDRIAILGTVDDLSDFGFMGNSVALKKCYVFAIGEEASKYDKGKTSKKLSKYLVTTQDVANSSDVSENDYKKLCEELNYEDVLRNPDTYKKKYCKVSGNVEQIIEGFFKTYTIYVEDSSGDKWECVYRYKEGESHVLEGDNVTIYGQCNGTTTATTVLGKQVTLPEVDAKYIN